MAWVQILKSESGWKSKQKIKFGSGTLKSFYNRNGYVSQRFDSSTVANNLSNQWAGTPSAKLLFYEELFIIYWTTKAKRNNFTESKTKHRIFAEQKPKLLISKIILYL